MTEPQPGPREVFERGQRLLMDLDVNGFADLFAPDGVIEFPFAPPPLPGRREGREEIRREMRDREGRARAAGVRILASPRSPPTRPPTPR